MMPMKKMKRQRNNFVLLCFLSEYNIRKITFAHVVNPIQPFITNTLVGAIGILALLRGICTVKRPLSALINIYGINRQNPFQLF